MMVFCTVTAFGKSMTAFLPVMNNNNQPVSNPDAGAVNKAMQRCLVKGIALHGIALYIYEGEDFPEEDGPEPIDATEHLAAIAATADVEALRTTYIASVKACAGDVAALKQLEHAKDKRKIELSAAQGGEA
jgi:hypothetical protein